MVKSNNNDLALVTKTGARYPLEVGSKLVIKWFDGTLRVTVNEITDKLIILDFMNEETRRYRLTELRAIFIEGW